ncbi:phosphoglycerate kinase [Candidatus Daviesbacteria bacterium]|nr:phosphoglycerate kinase [Candidatus Daviesbacteria bacterium]
MVTISPGLIQGKRVLLRLDLDVSIIDGKIVDDFRLKAALPTLKLCLEGAQEVIIMGHIGRPRLNRGRPQGKEGPSLSVAPIHNWLETQGFDGDLASDKLKLLENLRFEKGESEADLDYAKQLAKLGDFFVNEAFAAHHPAASTTVLPTLLPHCAGLRFAKEVEKLTQVRENPTHPLVVIIGGVKVEDKQPVINSMAKVADAVLVGGKIASDLKLAGSLPANVFLGKLNESGEDLAPETTQSWENIIKNAKMIVWNGPLGKVEDPKNDQTQKVAQMVVDSGAQTIVGGGDTITALDKWGLLDKFSFISTGGGAMLKFLAEGTLPTIEALND